MCILTSRLRFSTYCFWAALLCCAIGTRRVEAQSVVLPSEIRAAPGAWMLVVPSKLVDGAKPQWRVGAGLTEVNVDVLIAPDKVGKFKVLQALKPGRYKVEAWVAGDEKLPLDRLSVLAILQDKSLTDANKVAAAASLLQGISVCWVIVGDPGPDPMPPDPPKPPDPPIPAPTGARVLLINESSGAMSKGQLNVWNSTELKAYLDAKCIKGSDGRAEWRKWDRDIVLTKETPTLTKLWEATRPQLKALPCIVIVTDGSGEIHPLPETIAETLTLLKRKLGE